MRYIDANYMKMPIKIVSVKVRSFHLKRFTIFKANNSHTIYVEVGKIELMEERIKKIVCRQNTHSEQYTFLIKLPNCGPR